jgi:energy-coupling factor transporter ATP-binding protein EcfA2
MPAFTARELETQILLEHVRKQRSVLVLGRGGIGKSALLEQAAGILEVETLVVKLERIAPFANFLRDLFNRLFDARALDSCTFLPEDALYADLEETRKLWMKFNPNNDTKARSLTDSLEKYAVREARAVIVIDDLTGISPTIVPWVVELEQVCTLVCAAPFEVLHKAGTKRAWKVFEELRLEPFNPRDSNTILEGLMLEHRIQTDDEAVYKQRVLAISAGIPGELERLVKYHSSEPLVKSREVTQLGQGSVDREESGIALAPILFALGAFTVAWRYIARARGDLDAYVLSGILVGVFMVARLAFGRALKNKSR